MLVLLILISSLSHARSQSRMLPVFQAAIESWSSKTSAPYRPEILAIHEIFERENLDAHWLMRYLKISMAPLPNPVPKTMKNKLPLISFHVVRMDVIKSSDDWMKDDLYCYFFVTDGVIPIGKVSQTYRGLSEGESFHFSPEDRVLYPIQGSSRIPMGQVIVDYGIIESDGDDIKKLHQLTQVIAELAVGVYSVLNPEEAQQWGSLRDEVVALSRALVSLDYDDRLATGTIVINENEIRRVIGNGHFGEIHKIHQNNHFFDKWRYRLVWRLFKEEM